MTIKKRCFVRIISFLSVAVIVASGFAIKECYDKNYLKDRIALGYKQSLSEFSSLLNEINFSLKKQLYSSSSEMLSALSADIYKNSAAAKECLERLPVSQENTENIYKFLATAGDFSRAVAISDTDEVAKENKTQLKKLINFSEKLTDEITQTAMQLEDSESLSEDVENVMNNLENETTFSSSAEDISEIAAAVPTLIYDGPFSDHVTSTSSKLLEGKPTVSQEDALKKACEYADDDNLQYTCDEDSNTESYIFENGNTVCAITKKGGYCLYMNKTATPEAQNISEEEACENAKKYLNTITGLTFKESYHIINENILTVNLAFYENGIIFYPDLIKVGINLENGEVVLIEGRSFLMNHYARDSYTYKNSEAKAKSVVNDELTIKSCSKALITDDALNEKYCYEFICKAADGEDVIVYINEQALKEENIFIIVHTTGGSLVS